MGHPCAVLFDSALSVCLIGNHPAAERRKYSKNFLSQIFLSNPFYHCGLCLGLGLGPHCGPRMVRGLVLYYSRGCGLPHAVEFLPPFPRTLWVLAVGLSTRFRLPSHAGNLSYMCRFPPPTLSRRPLANGFARSDGGRALRRRTEHFLMKRLRWPARVVALCTVSGALLGATGPDHHGARRIGRHLGRGRRPPEGRSSSATAPSPAAATAPGAIPDLAAGSHHDPDDPLAHAMD